MRTSECRTPEGIQGLAAGSRGEASRTNLSVASVTGTMVITVPNGNRPGPGSDGMETTARSESRIPTALIMLV